MSDTSKPQHVHGRMFGKMLCETLGLDPNKVTFIGFDAHMDRAAHVTVTYLLTPEECERLTEGLKEYRLVEMSE